MDRKKRAFAISWAIATVLQRLLFNMSYEMDTNCEIENLENQRTY